MFFKKLSIKYKNRLSCIRLEYEEKGAPTNYLKMFVKRSALEKAFHGVFHTCCPGIKSEH